MLPAPGSSYAHPSAQRWGFLERRSKTAGPRENAHIAPRKYEEITNLCAPLPFFLVLTVATHAADTAYSALRVLGAQRGEDSLRRGMELRGSRGTWRVLLADSRARTGWREVQVRDGRIIRDLTVARPHDITTPLNLSALNLDSDGALVTVNQHASHAFPADRVDYTLINNSAQNVPVWILKMCELRDARGTSQR